MNAAADFKEQLRRVNHRKGWEEMAQHCLQEPELIPLLFDFLIEGKDVLARRCAEIIRVIYDKKPEIVIPQIDRLIDTLEKPTHSAIKRCIFRMFQQTEFTEEQTGKVVDLGFQHLQNRENPIAVRVFAMTTIYGITKKYPEILPELEAVITENLSEESTGFQNRAHKILNKTWK